MTVVTSDTDLRLGPAPDAGLLDPAERMGLNQLRERA
jgi:hypothetical protein